MERQKVYIGIDVGKDGGIVAVDESGKITLKATIPKIADKVDYSKLFEILSTWILEDVTVAIEDVHSIFGASAKSNFSFGEIKGIKIGMIKALGYRYTMVQPKAWQKTVWVNDDKVYKPKKPDAKTNRKIIDTKKTSLLAAKRLFPGTDFRRSLRCKNQHDGMIDAALIALWTKWLFKG